MQVILTKEVLGLGDPGEVVSVRNGYGRNYLIPQGMAIEASKRNIAQVEEARVRIAAQMAKEAETVKSEADKLAAVSLSTKAKAGEGGKLYGSVTNMDIAKLLEEQGFEIDRRRIMLEAPIKQVGSYDFKVKLHPQVSVNLAITVEGEEPEVTEKPADEAAPEVEAAAEGDMSEEAEAAPEADEAAEAPEAETKE